MFKGLILYKRRVLILYKRQGLILYKRQGLILYKRQGLILYKLQGLILYKRQGLILYKRQGLILYKRQGLYEYHPPLYAQMVVIGLLFGVGGGVIQLCDCVYSNLCAFCELIEDGFVHILCPAVDEHISVRYREGVLTD